MGWFRQAESDISAGAPVGSLAANTVTGTTSGRDGSADADLFIFYNQIKSVPGFLIEPYYVLYMNNQDASVNRAFGLGTAKHSNQIRHMLGNRIEMRKGDWDFTNETAYQFGAMGDPGTNGSRMSGNEKNIHINAWATRNW
ncbi:MAG: hypothetical protein ACKO9T_04305, partial [Nitrospira sp.]